MCVCVFACLAGFIYTCLNVAVLPMNTVCVCVCVSVCVCVCVYALMCIHLKAHGIYMGSFSAIRNSPIYTHAFTSISPSISLSKQDNVKHIRHRSLSDASPTSSVSIHSVMILACTLDVRLHKYIIKNSV